ncbi:MULTISPECIES: hypothetical protein [unclassified Sphingomonas]|uniref:hypothetical protein n=1 Tax=unclassified Sphingomonas TaxID=196159 RepID=UPI00226A51A8|nr:MULTISPECIES: hypothetical protein [unclassified Sphingomonas]
MIASYALKHPARFRRLVERIAAWTDGEVRAVSAAQVRYVAQVVLDGADPEYPPFEHLAALAKEQRAFADCSRIATNPTAAQHRETFAAELRALIIRADHLPWHERGGHYRSIQASPEAAGEYGAMVTTHTGQIAAQQGRGKHNTALIVAAVNLLPEVVEFLALPPETCAAKPDQADILETIHNASDDWQKHGYTSALAEVRDMANVGRSLMERLPAGYSYCDCPSEIVTDLQNELAEARAATPPY